MQLPTNLLALQLIDRLSLGDTGAKRVLLDYYLSRRDEPGVVLPTLILYEFATLGVYGKHICALFGECRGDLHTFREVVDEAIEEAACARLAACRAAATAATAASHSNNRR